MKKLNPKKIIYIIVGVIVVSYIIFKFCLELWGSYTVCKIREVNTARGGTSISYEFYYKGKKRYGNIKKPFRKENEGHYYFVKFWPMIPRVNLLQTDYPADSCATEYQNVVLDEIPDCFPPESPPAPFPAMSACEAMCSGRRLWPCYGVLNPFM